MSQRDHVDVAIVGSGPAGSTYARLICDLRPDARVLLIKAGPVVSQPPGTHVNTIEDPDARARAKVASQGPTQYAYRVPSAELRLLAHHPARDGSISAHTGLFLLGATQQASPGFPAASLANNVGGMGAHWFGACPRPAGTERIGFLDETTLKPTWRVHDGRKAAPGLRHPIRGLASCGPARGRPGRTIRPWPGAGTHESSRCRSR